MYACYFNMDTGCVDAWLTDGHILSIDCTKVALVEAENMCQRSELDYLIYNDPAAYVELIVEGDPKRYLQTVTRYELPEEMNENQRLLKEQLFVSFLQCKVPVRKQRQALERK